VVCFVFCDFYSDLGIPFYGTQQIATGRPLGEHANKYVSHCGYLVRDQIPINAREWREKRGAPEISFVSDRDKKLVWKAVMDVFTFNTND